MAATARTVVLTEGLSVQALLPTVGQRVRVVGSTEEYMVIRVDRARHLVDLMRMTGIRRVEEGVSLLALRPLVEME